MRCPFTPNCRADLDVDFGDALVVPYPAHRMVGPDMNVSAYPCPAAGVKVMRNGSVHASEHARLAEQFEIWADSLARVKRDGEVEAELDRRRAQIEERIRQADERREAAEFDDFANRAARAVEERHRRRIWREPDLPIARDGLDEQTIREILDDDTIRLIEPGDGPDAARSGPADRRRDDPDDNVVPMRRGQVPPGFPVGRGQTRPDDEYPSGAELDPELDLTPVPIEGHEDDIEGYAVGAGPDRPIDEFYPGRPADAPEPGPGEPPAERVPLDIGGEHLGRAAVDNARDQLRGLLNAVIEQSGQGQDTLAKATAMCDSIDAYRMAAEQATASASSLATVAVGSDSNVPQAAHDMTAALLVCQDRLTAEGGELAAAVVRVRELIADVHRELGVAANAARDYSAQV